MTVHIVTDSTSDFISSEAAALGVRVVPLTVRFGEETFRDGVDIDAPTFYRRLAGASRLPVTSQPTPNDFAEVYRELLASDADRVVSIHISSKWSGTIQSANLAAQEFGDRVTCVDSLSVSAGMQILVRGAAADVADGLDAATVVANLESRRRRLSLFVMLDTLTYLQKGGRIGRAQAFVGGVLNVKPVLRLSDGEAQPQARVRNRQQGISKLVELLAVAGPLESVGMMVSGDPGQGDEVRARLLAAYPELELHTGVLGPVVGVYAGPGAVGVTGLAAG